MIGIIILTYVNWGDTRVCINSILEHENQCDYHIYVVDNASPVLPDESIRKVLQDSRITYIRSKHNRGYSAGNNIGIKAALRDGCHEILIANNDIEFKDGSIYNLYKYISENESVGIAGPKIYKPDGKVQMINMGIKTGLKEKYMYLLKKTVFSHFIKDFLTDFCALDNDLSKPFEVHSVSGCCFMMSEKCARDITPFDENTFLYEEERILGIRAEEKGYKTVYMTESVVIHAHGQSTQNIKAFSYICFVESELYYCKKYLNASNISIIPLYLIRTLKYFQMTVKYNDYRANFIKYFRTTIRKLSNEI